MSRPARARHRAGPGRAALARPGAIALLALAVVLAAARLARADALGAYFEADALPSPGFELRSTLSLHYASRDDFASPVFLYSQPVQAIDARELRGELDLRVSVAHALALQAVVPLVYRSVETTLDGVLVSQEQQLRPATLERDGFGVGDSTLALALRFVQSEHVAAFVDLGTIVPLDDNPGSNTLARRIPAGTGQSALLLGLGASVRLSRLSASLGYRIAFAPGDAATYLVRRVNDQGYTSGTLAPFLTHRVTLDAGYAVTPLLSLSLRPDYTFTETADLVVRGGTLPTPGPRTRSELGVALRVQLALAPHHRLVLGYAHTLLDGHEDDPFFPLAIPARGPSLSWHVTGE